MTDDLPALTGPVEVVGAGLIGTSIALVCRRLGLEVVLRDDSAKNVRTATGLGAGRAATPADRPQLVVVAVPPAIDALRRTDAVVTDVGSVKAAPLEAVAAQVAASDLARYVGSHPMAGSERSGPLAASAALFDGRPWAVTPHAGASDHAVGLVESLVVECGAAPLRMDPGEHDRAVARISHLPHLAAVLVAGRLAAAPAQHLALSGQGVCTPSADICCDFEGAVTEALAGAGGAPLGGASGGGAGEAPPAAGAGAPLADEGSGCSATAARRDGGPWLVWLGVLLLAARARRR